jgi:hypothetical protein
MESRSSSSSSDGKEAASSISEEGIKSEDSVYSDTEDNIPPLVRHITYQGGVNDPEEAISFYSILKQNNAIALPDACTNALKVSAGGGYFTHGCPFMHFTPVEAAQALPHAYSTHIFKRDGSGEIDEKLLGELISKAVMYHGRKVITEPIFRTFLNECRANEQNPDFIGHAASEGEIEGLFSNIANGKTKEGERYISANRLAQYYKDSSKVGRKIEEQVRNGTFQVKNK